MRPRAYSARMAEAAIARADPARVKWHYEDGFLLQALQRVAEDSGNAACGSFVRASIDHLVDGEGRIAAYRREEYNLDQINPGKVLFSLLRDTADRRYGTALEHLREQLRRQPRTRSGGFWHKKIYPEQMWLDGLYMAAPFYARYAAAFGEPEALHDVLHQLFLMEEHARDLQTGLLCHAWDESRRQLWANPESGRSPSFWARGMGWYAMALVDVLDFLQDSDPGKSSVISILHHLMRAVAGHRDEDSGLWFQVIDQGQRAGNYLESSASCMFVYAILKAVRRGYLRDEELRETAHRAYGGIVKNFIRTGADGYPSLTGTCASAGLGGSPYRDGSFAYYAGEKTADDDPKGLASFILASTEMESELTSSPS